MRFVNRDRGGVDAAGELASRWKRCVENQNLFLRVVIKGR